LPKPVAEPFEAAGQVAAIGPEGQSEAIRHHLLLERGLEVGEFDARRLFSSRGPAKSVVTVSEMSARNSAGLHCRIRPTNGHAATDCGSAGQVG
jgi:hypothetical protein